MLFKKIVSFVILAAAAASSLAATIYPVKHGSLIAGESVKVEGAGGAKIFFPASVGGTPIAGEYGAIVSTDNVPGMGIQVRSGLNAAPRDKKTWLYIDSNGRMYLSSYDMLSSSPSFATALNSQPVELDQSKYPGLLSATNVFPTYLSSANNVTYYLSGTNLYRTNALKKGAANSEVSTLISSNVSAAIGVDDRICRKKCDQAVI